MPPLPDPKLKRAKDLATAGDWRGALRIVARFPVLGEAKEAVTRAWNALQCPALYAEMGYDVHELVRAGVAAMCAKYGWDVPDNLSLGE